ncbi:MAG: IPT/TIG domain-containing protein [Myxococcota bacterium]
MFARLATAIVVLCLGLSCVDDDLGSGRTLAIDRISPNQAQQGEQVRVLGRGFGDARPEQASVWIGGVCTAITGWSDSAITAVVPQGAGLGERIIVVSAEGRTSNPATLSVVGEELPANVIYCDESAGR